MSKTLTAQLRKAIKDADVSCYQIWKQTGITQGMLSKFVNGKATMSIERAERVIDALGLTIKLTKKGA